MKGISCLFIFLLSSIAFAQKASLTKEDIKAAIDKGNQKKVSSLVLEGGAGGTISGFGGASTNYQVLVQTPTSSIEYAASLAAKEFRTFTETDVTEDMLKPVLTVPACAAKPKGSSSDVTHIVLRDEKKQTAIQPSSKEPYKQTAQNAFGAQFSSQCLVAQFLIEDLKKIRPNNEEFFITLVGGGSKEVDIRVKQKHFEKLP